MAIVNDPTFTGRYQQKPRAYGVTPSGDLSVSQEADTDWSVVPNTLGAIWDALNAPGFTPTPMQGSPGVVPGIVPTGSVPVGTVDPSLYIEPGPGPWQSIADAGVAAAGGAGGLATSIWDALNTPGNVDIPMRGSPGVVTGSVPQGVNPAIYNPPGEGPWQHIGSAAQTGAGAVVDVLEAAKNRLTRPGSVEIPMQGSPGVTTGSVPQGTVPIGRNVALPHSADTDWGGFASDVGSTAGDVVGWLGDIFGGDNQEIVMSGAPGVDLGTVDPSVYIDP